MSRKKILDSRPIVFIYVCNLNSLAQIIVILHFTKMLDNIRVILAYLYVDVGGVILDLA